jgi:hemolysin activation/secretion protein
LSVEDTSFDIRAYQIEGNTLLTQEQIDTVLSPLRGPDKTFDTLQQVVSALGAAYFNAGYPAVVVDLPEQDITDGTIRVSIVEGRIGKIRVLGNQTVSTERVLASLPVLREGSRPLIKELDDALAFANLTGARRLTVGFQSGETRGDIAARVNVTEYPAAQSFLSFDNSGNKSTGDYRLGMGWQSARAFGHDHMFVGQVLTSPTKPDQVQVFSLGYRLPLYQQRLLTDFTAAYSNVDAGTTLTTSGPLTFTGSGTILGIKLTRPTFLENGATRQYSLALDWRDYDNECALGGFGAASCGSAGEDVSLLPLTLGISQRSNLRGHLVQGSLRLSANLGAGPHGDQADLDKVRANARKHYRIVRANGSVMRPIAGDWLLNLKGALQYSPDALVSSEQFRIAGSGAVRGYEESSIANDKGAYFNLELHTPRREAPFSWKDASLRGLFFLDGGRVTRNHILASDTPETRSASLAGIGAGVRLNYRKNWNLDLDWGVALKDAGDQSDGDNNVYLRLNGTF